MEISDSTKEVVSGEAGGDKNSPKVIEIQKQEDDQNIFRARKSKRVS